MKLEVDMPDSWFVKREIPCTAKSEAPTASDELYTPGDTNNVSDTEG